VQGGKATVTSIGEVNAELNFGSNDASATGGIGGSIKSITEATNGAYVGMGFYTARQGRDPVVEEAMRISNEGDVGIGTTTPSHLLSINGTVNTKQQTFYLGTTGQYAAIGAQRSPTNLFCNSEIRFINENNGTGAGAMSFGTGLNTINEAMRITSAGDVGIGVTLPGSKLDVDGKGSFGDATTYALKLKSSSGARGINILSNDGTSRGGIDWSAADFIIRNASDDHLFRVNYSSKNATLVGAVTATNFILSSDKRLKENIEKVRDNRVKVDWKTFELKTEKGEKRYGVIAQELEENHPEFIKTDNEGFKSVKYIDLLIAKIAELEARLEKAGI